MNILCINIKNVGTEENAVAIEAQNSKTITPSWFKDEQGEGRVLMSAAGRGNIKISIVGDGKLTLDFMGLDTRFEGKRFPVWIDYKSIKVDGKYVLSSPVATWHDKPWHYEMPVKDEQEVCVEYEKTGHLYSRKELKWTILKLYPTSDLIENNIRPLTKKVKKMINHAK